MDIVEEKKKAEYRIVPVMNDEVSIIQKRMKNLKLEDIARLIDPKAWSWKDSFSKKVFPKSMMDDDIRIKNSLEAAQRVVDFLEKNRND